MNIQRQFVAVEQMSIEHGGAHVVSCGHRVHVASQVEVELFHRNDLAVATSCGASLDAKRWAHRWLADRDGGLATNVAETLAKAHRGCCLTFAEGCGRYCRHHHVLGLGAIGHCGDGIERDLGCDLAIGLEEFVGDASSIGNLSQRPQWRCLCDLKIRRKTHWRPLGC